MPFFFYLSGTVAYLTGGARAKETRWTALVARRARRLLLPFIAFGVAIVLAKRALAPVFAVDNLPDDVGDGLYALVWDTAHSPALSVWYLLALFVFSIATPLLMRADGGRLRLAALVAILLYPLPAPQVAYADRICGYYLFFIAGMLAGQAGARWVRALDAGGLLWTVPLAALLAVAIAMPIDVHVYRWWLLAGGLLSMPALHAIVRSPIANGSSWLLTLGQYSFVIYLLNTIFIGLAKGILLRFAAWDGANFIGFAIALMLAGVLGPMLTKRLAFRRVPALDRMTD
jgi:peptidoglycan/LPS O-acetylase OafA/YrhL